MFNEICINEEMLPIYIYMYIYIYWRLRQPGFDSSFGNLACLTTLKSSDRTKQTCQWMTIYIYIYVCVCVCVCVCVFPTPVGLSSLATEVNVAISVM